MSAELTEKVGIRANYTHTQAEDANTGDRLIRRAKHTGSVVLDWQVTEKADLTATVLHVGKRYEDAANTTELDAYTRLDLAGRMDLKPGWTVYARIENLFDEDIEEAMDYGTAGIFAYGGLRVSF